MARPRRMAQIQEPLECEVEVVHLDRVRAAQATLPSPGDTLAMSELFAALGDPTRLRVVSVLAGSEMCVCDIAASLGLSTSATSHQLRVLRSLGLVRPRREGRLVYYALDDDHVLSLYRQALNHVAHQTPPMQHEEGTR